MNAFKKDIVVGILFVLGLFGFMSGEFLVSTALFGIAAVTTNIKSYRSQDDHSDALCD